MKASHPILFLSYARADRNQAERLKAELEKAGHRCWMDMADLKGGRDWLDAIERAISRCYAFVSLSSSAANRSKYVKAEFLHAERLGKTVIPVLLEGVPPWYMANLQALSWQPDAAAALERLARDLPSPPEKAPTAKALSPRDTGLSYLRGLRLQDELQKPDLYIHMEGIAQRRRERIGATASHLFMRPEFSHIRRRLEGQKEAWAPGEEEPFEDILKAFPRIRRTVLLGDPGAGKTTTLWKVARDALSDAERDPTAVLPVLIRLGLWTDPRQELADFLRAETGTLAFRLDDLVSDGRLLLLLDGLNEIPVEQQEAKAESIRELVQRWWEVPVIVTCRGPDYRGALVLPLDTVAIRTLTPTRVREFLSRYLSAVSGSDRDGVDKAERLFWELAGGEVVRETWDAWKDAGAALDLFWSGPDIPREVPDVWSRTSGAQDQIWREHVKSPYNLVRLAANPYMLAMMLEVWLTRGENLPANRGQLFEEFVGILLARETLADPQTLDPTKEGLELLEALGRLAWRLQTSVSEGDTDRLEQARTSLPLAETRHLLKPATMSRAVGASLLEGGNDIRFTHQLLQEYFTALGMRQRLEAGRLEARGLWSETHWWRRSGWEEATVLLAGLYHRDCTPVIEWLRDAQPEVAADCILRSGARIPEETLRATGAAWLDRLQDPAIKEPEGWAAIGQALGRVRLNGRMLDLRSGVGLDDSGLPDITWVAIPAGAFIYQGGERRTLDAFHMARYPVTNEQFRAFLESLDGHGNREWWAGFESEYEEPVEPTWGEGNCPRETVDWYQALAFCRWLSARRGYEIRLPTEVEWERAARFTDGREYPWGVGLDHDKANAANSLGRTSPVGIYPLGRSREGVDDLAGNVWEWCLNKYDTPDVTEVDTSGDGRVVRGGSWLPSPEFARSAVRDGYLPGFRLDARGFRVLCAAPIRSEH